MSEKQFKRLRKKLSQLQPNERDIAYRAYKRVRGTLLNNIPDKPAARGKRHKGETMDAFKKRRMACTRRRREREKARQAA